MEPTVKNVEPDIVGRVMALEQRARGLHGRVSALEMRFSPGNSPVNTSAGDTLEFVPGEAPAGHAGPSLEDRVAALETAVSNRMPAQKVSMLDVTGILVGISLLIVGILLATDSVGLLKNPALAFAAGLVILACAAGRLLLK